MPVNQKGGETMKQSKTKQMPVGGVFQYGNATGKPASTGKIKYGSDLRDGGGKKK